MNAESFSIWVESEEYAHGPFEEDFLNVGVTFASGSFVGLNVWSYQFFLNHVNALQNGELEEEDLKEDYVALPDLVLKDLSPSNIRRVVSRLITQEKWLEGRGFPTMVEEDD